MVVDVVCGVGKFGFEWCVLMVYCFLVWFEV